MKYHVILEKKRQKQRRQNFWKKKLEAWRFQEYGSYKGRYLSFLYSVWQIGIEAVRICMRALLLLFAFLGMVSIFYSAPRKELELLLYEVLQEIKENFPTL